MPVHHLMVGTWTPPGAIFTFAFDDEALTLELVKRTEIPHDEPISWMTFNVCDAAPQPSPIPQLPSLTWPSSPPRSTTRPPSTALP